MCGIASDSEFHVRWGRGWLGLMVNSGLGISFSMKSASTCQDRLNPSCEVYLATRLTSLPNCFSSELNHEPMSNYRILGSFPSVHVSNLDVSGGPSAAKLRNSSCRIHFRRDCFRHSWSLLFSFFFWFNFSFYII